MILLAAAAAACCARAEPAAVVQMSLGTASVAHVASGVREPITNGLALNVGDVIQTADDGYVHALFGDGSLLAVRPNSAVRVASFSAKGDEQDALWLDLMTGAFRCVTGWISKARPEAFRVTNQTLTLGVRGTDFEMIHVDAARPAQGETAGTHALVHEGAVVLETQAGRLELQRGEAGFAARGNEPPRRHAGVPAFMQGRATKTDALVEEHAKHINEHMEKSLKERGLLRQGQSVKELIQERRGAAERREEKSEKSEKSEKPEKSQKPARPERHEPPPRPEKPERPERPERSHRKG